MEETPTAPKPQPTAHYLSCTWRCTVTRRRSVATLHPETQTKLMLFLAARRRNRSQVSKGAVNITGCTFPNEVLYKELDNKRSGARRGGHRRRRGNARDPACCWTQSTSEQGACQFTKASFEYPTAWRRHTCRVAGQKTSRRAASWRSNSPPASRDDVTQSTPALMVFRLMIAMCAAGLLGANACIAVFDVSVAHVHSRMENWTSCILPRPLGW